MCGETERILGEYARRAAEISPERYSPASSAQLLMRQTRERALLRLLREAGALPLGSRRILDVGCGDGQWLADLETWGASRHNLAGIDLVADRVAAARRRVGAAIEDGEPVPAADIREGDATALPWADASFHIVVQSMVISSVLDEEMRRAICREMARVLRDDGIVVWNDFIRDNPANRAVRGVPEAEVARLFPGFDARLVRSNLAPPLARAIAPRSFTAARLLEALRVANTHAVAVLVPRP